MLSSLAWLSLSLSLAPERWDYRCASPYTPGCLKNELQSSFLFSHFAKLTIPTGKILSGTCYFSVPPAPSQNSLFSVLMVDSRTPCLYHWATLSSTRINFIVKNLCTRFRVAVFAHFQLQRSSELCVCYPRIKRPSLLLRAVFMALNRRASWDSLCFGFHQNSRGLSKNSQSLKISSVYSEGLLPIKIVATWLLSVQIGQCWLWCVAVDLPCIRVQSATNWSSYCSQLMSWQSRFPQGLWTGCIS